MTLIVAAVTADSAWMVSDTLITGGNISLREREYQIKCLPSKDRKALIAFAGDAHFGAEFLEEASSMASGIRVVDALIKRHRDHRSVDLIYMFLDDGKIRLFKISDGVGVESKVAYIGSHPAFEHFQRIRNATEVDPVPKTVGMFIAISRSPGEISNDASGATLTMLRLIMERHERDIGGWAVSYMLSKAGASMVGYCYSSSDPIIDQLSFGSLLPHGTAEAGGYGLSVTEFGELEGLVVYWQQLPGGFVLTRSSSSYVVNLFSGKPSEFIEAAHRALGKAPEIFFGDKPLPGPPDHVTIFRDKNGEPRMAAARRNNSLSWSVLNVTTAFQAEGVLNLAQDEKEGRTMTVKNLTVTLQDDRKQILLQLLEDGKPVGSSTLNADELDSAINMLGRYRASLVDVVSPDPPKQPGTMDFVVLDPAWRTEFSPHAELDGIFLRLRHTGLGWLSFLLPHKESRNLGNWLAKNAKTGEP